MRLVFGIGSGLLVIFALLIAGARQIGHRQERDHFPLPSADGCWQDVCFLGSDEISSMLALARRPSISEITAERNGTASYHKFTLTSQSTTGHSFAVHLYISGPRNFYTLSTNLDNYQYVPMMRAGDLVAAFGFPDWINLGHDEIELVYIRDDIWIGVVADVTDTARFDGVRVLPTDSIHMITAGSWNTTKEMLWSRIPSRRVWRGFGIYYFER